MPKRHYNRCVKLGAKNLRDAAGKDTTIEEIAAALGFDRTYTGRILSGDREASLAFRQKARDHYGIGLDDWDQDVPDAEQRDDVANPPTSSLG